VPAAPKTIPPLAPRRRRSPLALVFIALIRLYQVFLSPFFGRNCRFLPTCSEYAIEAIHRKGAIVGALMAAWRILRCNPFCKGGYDPVR